MAKHLIGVVTRHLPTSSPTPSTVITVPSAWSHTDEAWKKKFIREEAQAHKKLFTDTMVEFKKAAWTLTFLEVHPTHATMLPTYLGDEELK